MKSAAATLESAPFTANPFTLIRQRMAGSGLPWLVPVLAVLGIFYAYPLLDVIRLAFTDQTMINSGETHYTLATFAKILTDPDLPDILLATFIFTGGSVIGQQLLGLAVAMIVVRGERRRLFGTTLLRTTALVAWVIPGIAGGLVWKMLFSEAPFGGINSVLRLMSLSPVAWLSDPDMTIWSVTIANVWRGTAFSMVVMYAALKALDPLLEEAAIVDGANPLQRFWHIVLPQLRTAVLVNMILITLQTINIFDSVISLTGGGPGRATEVIALHTYFVVFRNLDLAGGAVLSIVMLAISLILALGYAILLPKETSR